jgi:SAM-dependent methyltransferase
MEPRALTPLDADTDDVERFAVQHLPAPPATVLEIGAGDGRLAARLVARGFSVKAIDVSDEVVVLAAARGVDAACVDYFDVRGQFDALLFTRSFHHLWPLDKAVAHAATLLAPRGVLVFDELAHDACDLPTAAWFYDVQALLEEAGVLAEQRRRGHPRHHHHHHHQAHDEDAPKTPLERWRKRHSHEPPLHAADAMLHALGAAFELTSVSRLPYLYRYFAERLESKTLFDRVRALEADRIALELVVPIGLRIVARS